MSLYLMRIVSSRRLALTQGDDTTATRWIDTEDAPQTGLSVRLSVVAVYVVPRRSGTALYHHRHSLQRPNLH